MSTARTTNSSFVQIKQKAMKRKKLVSSHDHQRSRLLVRNTHRSNNLLSLLATNFLDGGFLFFFFNQSKGATVKRTTTRALLLFSPSFIRSMTQKNLFVFLLFSFSRPPFFYPSHTISLSIYIYIYMHIFLFFLVGEAGGGWTGLAWGMGIWGGMSGIGVHGGKDFFLGEFFCTHMKDTRPRIRRQRCKLIISIIHVYD